MFEGVLFCGYLHGSWGKLHSHKEMTKLAYFALKMALKA